MATNHAHGIDLTDREISLVTEAVRSGWISGVGPSVSKFERGLASQIGVREAIAVANGTLALELALRALGVGPADEVLVPALTFAAPAMSVLAVGATPVFVDVDPHTWTIDPAQARAALSPKVRALIAVDVLGRPAEYDELAELGVPVIEDAAEAHGATYKGRQTGSLGDVAIFSFYANKTITTGEGGAVCTDDPDLADRMRLMCNHGMRAEERYVHRSLGRNFRMTNLSASIGVGQLERWDDIVARRAEVTGRYDSVFAALGLRVQKTSSWSSTPGWIGTACVPETQRVLARLVARGIDARLLWPALTRQPYLRAWATRPCPAAEEIARSCIQFPTSSTMTVADIAEVGDALAAAMS